MDVVKAGSGDEASQLLKLWGRDQGLCVIIGAGKPESIKLATELASTGKILVHGIALDEKSLLEGRKLINKKGCDGFVSLERLGLNPLPYRNNLVNFVVVNDPGKATAAGFNEKEAMRVLAPWGKLCVRDSKKWRMVTKELSTTMDEWTHNVHGPDGNRVSRDTGITFPVGYLWHGGLPFNIDNSKRHENRYSSTRAMAIIGGRCFTFSDSVIENLSGAHFIGEELDQYVTAHDAFNGIVLWRKRIGRVFYGGLWYMNWAPFAAVGDRVYTVSEKGALQVLDAATGDTVNIIVTTHVPGEILVDQGIVVSANWKDGTWLGESKINAWERIRMHSGVSEGTIEAFDCASGKRLWQMPNLATSIRSAGGVVFASLRAGVDLLEESHRQQPRDSSKVKVENPKRPAQSIVALDLKTGKQLWQVTAEKLSPTNYETVSLRVDTAGLGVVTVILGQISRESDVTVLSAKTGECLIQPASGTLPVLLDGAIHMSGKKYDPATGKELGISSNVIGATVCTPSYVVGDIIIRNRGCAFSVGGKPMIYAGARGACYTASIPAYGALYTPQNWCTCCPPQIAGFICFGPIRAEPGEADMLKAPVVEKGTAYDRPITPDAGTGEWPMFRQGVARSSSTTVSLPSKLNVKWQQKIPTPKLDSPIALNWREFLNSSLSAPTVAGGVVVTAVMDANQVVGLDLATGRIKWCFTVGARVDSSPTIQNGVCVFGSHDGYIYALDGQSGKLKWKSRLAPGDERLVSYGKVESVWPVIGTVLVSDDLVYASAGRTQGSDGGIVVRALSLKSGDVVWSRALPPSDNVHKLRRNDLLLKTGDTLQLMNTRLDLKNGEIRENPLEAIGEYQTKLQYFSYSINQAKLRLKTATTGKEAIEKQIAKLEAEQQALKKPESEIAPFVGNSSRSREGFVDWTWPRLGDRIYMQMNYGNISGSLVSWDGAGVCSMKDDRNISYFTLAKVGKAGEKVSAKADWTLSLPSEYQVTAMVLCPAGVVVSGGIYSVEKQAAKGFVTVISRDGGTKNLEQLFDAPVVFGGTAVLNKKICVTLVNSSICLVTE